MTRSQRLRRTVRWAVWAPLTLAVVALIGVQVSAALDSPNLPACETEDAPGPCYWDASACGNHQGQSFTRVGDVVTYLP